MFSIDFNDLFLYSSNFLTLLHNLQRYVKLSEIILMQIAISKSHSVWSLWGALLKVLAEKRAYFYYDYVLFHYHLFT